MRPDQPSVPFHRDGWELHPGGYKGPIEWPVNTYSDVMDEYHDYMEDWRPDDPEEPGPWKEAQS